MTIEGHYYEQHGRDLHALIESLGLKRVVLVGWSSGGADALEYVRQFGGDKVAGLILLNTCPKVRGTDNTKEWVWSGTINEGDQDGSLRLFSYDVMIDRQKANRDFAEWMLYDPSPRNIQFVYDQTNNTPNSIAALLNMSYWFTDGTEPIKSLDGKVPLLYFVHQGWKDLATVWSREHTPHADIVESGKHMNFWEHPGKFDTTLDEFLTKVE